ncbi:MAG: SAM-dependent methyltransferase [Bifidobacteriaceae bacterium]|nr:SAM-dependent methyltransferase [Bifidobacteriaceae bacterium]
MSALIKSRKRVIDHGEVFTPPQVVEAMLDLVRPEAERIDSRFLEPACGSGNFLVAVLRRKLASVEARYSRCDFERRHYALLALMSLYGIELLEDNAAECRENLVAVFSHFLGDDAVWLAAARAVLRANIVWGDALTMKACPGSQQAIVFAEWSYLGKGLYQRRDFRYDTLARMASYGFDQATLFGEVETHDVFQASRGYPPMTYQEVARG